MTLSAAYKYEDRDNQSPIYSFLVAGGDAASAPSKFTTEPLNRRMQQLRLDADYAIAAANGPPSSPSACIPLALASRRPG